MKAFAFLTVTVLAIIGFGVGLGAAFDKSPAEATYGAGQRRFVAAFPTDIVGAPRVLSGAQAISAWVAASAARQTSMSVEVMTTAQAARVDFPHTGPSVRHTHDGYSIFSGSLQCEDVHPKSGTATTTTRLCRTGTIEWNSETTWFVGAISPGSGSDAQAFVASFRPQPEG